MTHRYGLNARIELATWGQRLSLCIALCGLGCGSSSHSAGTKLSKEEEAFLSYWQAAGNLISGLMHLKSHDEFVSPIQKGVIQPPPKRGEQPIPAKTMKEILDGLCKQVETYRDKVRVLSADDVARFHEKHKSTVEMGQAAFKKLAARHAKSPKILGDDWERYRQALQLTDDGK